MLDDGSHVTGSKNKIASPIGMMKGVKRRGGDAKGTLSHVTFPYHVTLGLRGLERHEQAEDNCLFIGEILTLIDNAFSYEKGA